MLRLHPRQKARPELSRYPERTGAVRDVLTELIRIDHELSSETQAGSLGQAVSERGFFGNQNTVARPTTAKWNYTIQVLKDRFEITITRKGL